MEAYAILSVMSSRANYDLLRQRNPDSFKEISQHEFDKNYNAGARDASGNVPTAAPAKGSYAETRLAELKEQRKQYNVNDLGFYRGGVPQKRSGSVRGSALGAPGDFHDPKIHNFFNFYHPDAKIVNSEDSVKFKAYMLSDKETGFNVRRPSHPMYYDRTMEFTKDRSFWLMLILGLLGGMYATKKYQCEKERMNRWVRMQDLENLPAHHFNNRGGVLVKKQFAGFEKYHKNLDEMMAWYQKTYPDL